jgi:two-component system sensor histidine kinase KdpD
VLSGHKVSARLPADLPLCEFDPVLIERVLVNLLENAAKYTPPGSEIVVSATVGDGTLRVSVDDNGPGLPAGREETLFAKFERGENESAMPGVGLGLAICRAIVEAHGGRIYAENRHEGGARFVFTLPFSTSPTFDEKES